MVKTTLLLLLYKTDFFTLILSLFVCTYLNKKVTNLSSCQITVNRPFHTYDNVYNAQAQCIILS